MFINRKIQPGYNTGYCSIELVEKINCEFAKQLYAKFIEKRYGVEQGIEDKFDQFSVKKNLLELNLINNPDFCIPISCCPPCAVKATIFYVKSSDCQPPYSIELSVIGGSIECIPPRNITGYVNYDS